METERHVAAADGDQLGPLLILGHEQAALGAIGVASLGQQRRAGTADHRDGVRRLETGNDGVAVPHVEDGARGVSRQRSSSGRSRWAIVPIRNGTDHVLANRLAVLDDLESVGEAVRQRRLVHPSGAAANRSTAAALRSGCPGSGTTKPPIGSVSKATLSTRCPRLVKIGTAPGTIHRPFS